MIKNIFLTGLPGSGKTTLIKEIINELNLEVSGFYTSEIRKNGKRVGFEIFSLDGKKGTLAHQDLKSQYCVSKYKVNLKDLEEIGVKAIEEGIKNKKIIIIDEIGKMEILSEKFKEVVLKALESKNLVLGTIKATRDHFTDKIKNRKDTKVFFLKPENKEEIKKEILNFLWSILKTEKRQVKN